MPGGRTGAVAVIFTNRRTQADDSGYAAAAEAMEALAATQPGYLGIDSVRDADGFGITVSYWQDEAAAKAWRANVDHAAARARGRDIWYESWHLYVTRIERDYGSGE
jgi:heme-degrading monooxygenase HmoA